MEQQVLEAVHNIQIGMIKELHKLCNENNLHYIVICGSLLGAIRHKGFIPWDDDVDIGLVREDYEKLLDILKKNPIEGCFLQEYSTDPHYYLPYAKLLKNNTTYIEEHRKNCKAKNGIFIDIFPLDHIKKPGNLGAQFRRKSALLIEFAICHKEHCTMIRKGFKKLVNVAAAILSIFPKSFLISIQNKLVVRNHPEWRYLASMFSSHYDTDRLYFEKTEFENLVELPFEDTVVNGPENWEENLKRLYKDYMELPPEETRKRGHGVFMVKLDENIG